MKPVTMYYVGLNPTATSVYIRVDVYQFFLKEDGTSAALCWFVTDREWMVVDIEMLVPSKPILNE